MLNAKEIEDIKASLTRKESEKSEHFIIYFMIRNPPVGEGHGRHGVRDKTVVETCLKALELLYQTITSPPWNRQQPLWGRIGKTEVYLFDIYHPITSTDLKNIPHILLPSNNEEPVIEAEIQRVKAESVHEATHIFNYRKRPAFDDKGWPDVMFEIWEWFDEGFATFMERVVLPDNQDCFRYFKKWITNPEIPLDHEEVMYQSSIFIRYLAKRFGNEFVNDVWVKSTEYETPFHAIARMLPTGHKFVSSDTAEQDVFSSYCEDAYFLSDPESDCFEPELFRRYGERAVTESFDLGDGCRKQLTNAVDHLACRYYRFYVKQNIEKIRAQLLIPSSTNSTPLKASMAVVTKQRKRGSREFFRPTENIDFSEIVSLSAELSISNREELDHITVIISNCGIEFNHDRQSYTIEVSV